MLLCIPPAICVYLCINLFKVILKGYKATTSSTKRKVCLTTYIILGLPIAIYPYTMIADLMMFDRPSSEKDPMIWLLFTIFAFYPLVLMSIMWIVTNLLTDKKSREE